MEPILLKSTIIAVNSDRLIDFYQDDAEDGVEETVIFDGKADYKIQHAIIDIGNYTDYLPVLEKSSRILTDYNIICDEITLYGYSENIKFYHEVFGHPKIRMLFMDSNQDKTIITNIIIPDLVKNGKVRLRLYPK